MTMTARQRTTRSRRRRQEPEAPLAPNETIQIEALEDESRPTSAEPQPATAQIKERRRPVRRRLRLVGAGVWIGLLLTAAGFGLIAFTWGKTAALVNVAEQIPYLVSGGLSGVGLILLGLLVVNLSVKRREALDRARQLEELRDALVQLRTVVEGETEAPS
jgi:hypothetical protein